MKWRGRAVHHQATLESLSFEWSSLSPQGALRCLPAIVIVLVTGILVGHPTAGMIAAGGAFSVGLGSFQKIRNSCLAPMLLASFGMCASTFVGTLAGRSTLELTMVAALWGFSYGLSAALEAGTSWVALQCVLAMLVVSAYPVGINRASSRAELILAGGLFQTVCVMIIERFQREPCANPADLAMRANSLMAELRSAMGKLAQNLNFSSATFRYALRMGITLGLTAGGARFVSVQNGYWVPMTTLLVLKPDLRQTYVRCVARILGTLTGAAIATFIAAKLQPGHWALAIVVIVAAACCYSLYRVNYAAYTLFITVYIVFLLAFAGLPEMRTVKFRALNTVIGGLLALLAHASWPIVERRNHVAEGATASQS
jgi:hypothetical protein